MRCADKTTFIRPSERDACAPGIVALVRAGAAAVGLATSATPARAQEATLTPPAAATPAPAPAERATMTGDWGGARTALKQAGVTIRGDYVSESFAAVSGGEKRGSAYAQQVRLGADFDMDRLAGWEGATFHLTVNDRRGVGISSDYVGNRLPIQEAYGGLYTRLTEASYEQALDGGKLDLRIGFFAMGNDLGGMALGCNFVNAAFCAHPLSLSGDSGWYNYPNARWGGTIRYRPRPDLALRTGVYQVNPALNDEANAFKPFAGGTTGVLLPLELEYDPGSAAGSRAKPGHYKLGIYYDTSRAAREGESGTVKGRYGVYLLADQMIVRRGSNGRGISLFGQFTAQPDASAQIPRWLAAGLLKTGTFEGRDADTIALGFVYAELNPRLRRLHAELVTTPGVTTGLLAGEQVIELSYGFQARRWLNIRPDVQYVVHPGAFSYRATGNALALGTQAKAQF